MPTRKTTKEEIIFACSKVFREKGYYNSSVADLAAACGISKGLFYHHYKNKEELMIEAIKFIHQFIKEKLFSVAFSDETAKYRVSKLIAVCMKVFVSDMCGCFIGNTVLETASSDPKFKPYLKQFFKDWKHAMIVILKDNIVNEKPEDLADKVIVDIEGSLMLMRLYDDPGYLKKSFERLKALV